MSKAVTPRREQGAAGGGAPRLSTPQAVTEAGPSPKACQNCARIDIGGDYHNVSPWRVFLALPFVYLPVLVMPVLLLGAGMAYLHLRLMGARNLKTLRDFMPAWNTHRYRFKTYVVKHDIHWLARWARTRTYWFLNCSLYCPLSVASLEWATYLTKAIENWWCPFHHEHKPNYANAAIDASFWHVSKDVTKLHPDDRDNPIWNRRTDDR